MSAQISENFTQNKGTNWRAASEVHASATIQSDTTIVSGLAAPCTLTLPQTRTTLYPLLAPTQRLGGLSLNAEFDVEDADGSGAAFAITIVPDPGDAGVLINGAASYVLPANARAKITWVPSLAAGVGGFTAQLYEPGAGGVVGLLGNVIGPSNANRVARLSGPGAGAAVAQDSTITIQKQQGGSIAVPTLEDTSVVLARDPTVGSFSVGQVAVTDFLGTKDYTFTWGYNINSGVAGVPTIRNSIECDFQGPPGQFSIEGHFAQTTIPAGWHGSAGYSYRPFTTNAFASGIAHSQASAAGGGNWLVVDPSYAPLTMQLINHNGQQNYSEGLYSAIWTNTNAGLLSAHAFADATAAVQSIMGYWDAIGGALVTTAATKSAYLGRCAANGSGRRALISWDGNHNGVQLFTFATNGATGVDLGGGVGVLGWSVATTAPTANPATGFVLYVDPADGVLKARGSGGTITPIALP